MGAMFSGFCVVVFRPSVYSDRPPPLMLETNFFFLEWKYINYHQQKLVYSMNRYVVNILSMYPVNTLSMYARYVSNANLTYVVLHVITTLL